MPATPRPRGFAGSSGSIRTLSNTPMSERQQMALLMQMTSNANNQHDVHPTSSSSHGPARSRDRNERGETAMHVAAIKGDQDGIKKLIDHGMSANVADFAGWTPLHEACNHGHYNVAQILVKAGANVNARGLDDDTPLHDAAIVGQLKLVKMLVEKGADPNYKNRKGKTPCDVASSAVYNYLTTARDAAISRAQAQQQMKKAAEAKKSMEESEEKNVTVTSGSTSSGPSSSTKVANKQEDDVYEFKTTPKDSSSSSSDGGKNSDKSSDEKTDEQAKRSYSDIEGDGDDEVKKKKRKDTGDSTTKDGNKVAANRAASQRQDKSGKAPGNSAKNSNLTNKNVTALERKSPCGSPKPASTKTDSDAETDDNKSVGGDSFGSVGPKVPPLKIVIPQQNTTTDQEVGSRNGKNVTTRNHAALPYVVASSSNSNDSADKDSASSRCTSPSDSAKSTEEKKTSTGLSNEDQKQQRVLRSSNRGGGGSQSIDRGSNNSSPQLQSSSPSPAPVSQTGTTPVSTTSTTTTTTTTETTETNTKANVASNVSVSNSGNSTSPCNLNNNSESDATCNAPSPSASSTSSTKESNQSSNELHPRKRKIRASKDENKQTIAVSTQSTSTQSSNSTENNETISSNEIHPYEEPITNGYQMYLNIRKQIERRQQNLFPVQPKPPQGFKDYLLNRRSYVLAGKTPSDPIITVPTNVATQLKDLFTQQEKERHKLKMQHVVEKEKLVLSVEQEILRVHGRAARALANQSLPFSVCTILKDEEVYNMFTPEQEEKDHNARSRYNGRLFLSWLQDVDDKWEKIKEAMVLRHHNEAESLHAVQRMEWEWTMKELMLCEFKAQPIIEDTHVPMVHVSDDFDLLP